MLNSEWAVYLIYFGRDAEPAERARGCGFPRRRKPTAVGFVAAAATDQNCGSSVPSRQAAKPLNLYSRTKRSFSL